MVVGYCFACVQAPAAPAVKPSEKAPKKSSEKAAEKKGKNVEPVKEEPLDPVAEKLRQQRYISFHLIFINCCFFGSCYGPGTYNRSLHICVWHL